MTQEEQDRLDEALLNAAMVGDAGKAGALIGQGANVCPENISGNGPLHLAAREGHAVVVELLIARGADIGSGDMYGDRPLHLAAENGHGEVVEILIALGADVNALNHMKREALHHVANNGTGKAARVMELLVANGAQLDAADVFDARPLHLAAQNGREEMVKLLLGHGADPTLANDTGHKPGDLCGREIAELLAKAENEYPEMREIRRQDALERLEGLRRRSWADHLARQRKLGSLRPRGPAL